MTTEVVSHGRGGAGNINPDDTQYVDGTIRREEDPATTGGPYSTGRGGGGNIASGSPKLRPTSRSGDADVIPEVAKVTTHEGEGYHSGRGGEGNVHLPTATAEKKPDTSTEPEKPGKGTAPTKKSVTDRIRERLRAILSKVKDHKNAKNGSTPAPVQG